MTGTRARAARRVVSLVPSLTETLLGWGVEPVGVTRFCEVHGYPLVGGTKNPDIDAIVALRPDVVLVDREENRRSDAEALREAGLTVLAVHVRSVADVSAALAEVAAVVAPDRAEVAVQSGGGGHGEEPGGGVAAGLGSAAVPAVPVFVPIWRRPWMTIGASTYGSSVLSSAGLRNVYADSSEPYPAVELADAERCRPAFVLAPSEPYPFQERHRAELEQVAPVIFVDGKDLFWWGSRTPAARRRLARLATELAGR